MATEEDILEMLDSDDEPFKKEEEPKTNINKKKDNLWEKTEFTPLKIDSSNFLENTPKSFFIYMYSKDATIPEDIKTKLEKIVKALVRKQWHFRCNASSKEETLINLLNIEGLQTNIYLPWKGYNDKVTIKPTLIKTNEIGYRIASTYNKAFTKLPNAVRAIYGNLANCIFNVNGDDPVKLVLAYTSCGTEKINKDTDFTKLGNLSFIIKLCNEADIPLINLKKDNAIERIVNILS